MEKTASKRHYNSLDVLRFVCAFLVVGIHTEPFANFKILDMGFGVITRNAVPAFFMISSFLFFIKSPGADELFKYLKRIGIMYLFWIFVYLIIDSVLGKQSFNSLSSLLVQIFGGGGYSTLWFLQALIVSITIVFVLYKCFSKENVVLLICFALYLAGMALSTYYPLLSNIFIFKRIYNSNFISFVGTRNGIFYAPVFIAIGLKFANRPNNHSKKFYMTVLLFSFILLGIESGIGVLILKVSSTILWLFMVPLAYSLFGFILSCDLPDCKAYYFLRKSSTGIYLTHKCIIDIIGNLLRGIPLFIFVSAASFLISTGLYELSEHTSWRAWKYIL